MLIYRPLSIPQPFFLIKMESSDIVVSCCRWMEKSWVLRSKVDGPVWQFIHWRPSSFETVGRFIIGSLWSVCSSQIFFCRLLGCFLSLIADSFPFQVLWNLLIKNLNWKSVVGFVVGHIYLFFFFVF